jgi:hypothetical protein
MGIKPSRELIDRLRKANLSDTAAAGVIRDYGLSGGQGGLSGIAGIYDLMGPRKSYESYQNIMDYGADLQSKSFIGLSQASAAAPLAQAYSAVMGAHPGISAQMAEDIGKRTMGRISEMSTNPMNLLGWQDMRMLASFGITDPYQQQKFMSMGLDKPETRALLAKQSGVGLAKINERFGASRQQTLATKLALHGGNLESAILDLSGGDVQMAQNPTAFLGAWMGTAPDVTKSPTVPGGGLDLRTSLEHKMQKGEAAQESKLIEAMESQIGKVGAELSSHLYTVMGDGLAKMGEKFLEMAKKWDESKATNSLINRGYSQTDIDVAKAVTGAKNAQETEKALRSMGNSTGQTVMPGGSKW